MRGRNRPLERKRIRRVYRLVIRQAEQVFAKVIKEFINSEENRILYGTGMREPKGIINAKDSEWVESRPL